MSMNSYFTIGYGVSGPGLLPQQAVWTADNEYDALNVGDLPEFPGVRLLRTTPDDGGIYWYLLIKNTVQRFDHRGSSLTRPVTCLTNPSPEDMTDQLIAAHEAYVPEDAPQTRGWHIIHEVL